MTEPFITVVTPTHNRLELLKRTVHSVKSQSFSNWEMIIIDDSTNTDTEKLKHELTSDYRIKYYRNSENKGLPESRNIAFNNARGEWITLLDDDDYYATEETLSTIVNKLRMSSLPWVAFNKVSPDNTPITRILKNQEKYNWTTDFLFGKSLRGDIIPVFKRDFLGKIRYSGGDRSEWQFWHELSLKSDFVHYPIDVVIAEYLPDGMTNTKYKKREKVYLWQQFCYMFKNITTWRYLPVISVRYILSFKSMQWLYNIVKK